MKNKDDFLQEEIGRETTQEQKELQRETGIKNKLEAFLAARTGKERLPKRLFTHREIESIVGTNFMQEFYRRALELARREQIPELAVKEGDEIKQMRAIFALCKGTEVIYMGKNRDGVTSEYGENDDRLSLGRKYTLTADPFIATKTGHITIQFRDNKGNPRLGGYQRYGVPL